MEHSKLIRDGDMRFGASEHTIKTNDSVNLDDVAMIDNENRYYRRKKKNLFGYRQAGLR